MNDVEPQFYPDVIRQLIRHENELSNHRIMWLLIGQGLIANAFVNASSRGENVVLVFSCVGILLTFSAFVMLYKSYQARGYLLYLGNEAKHGTLREAELPLLGWPPKRIKGWRKKVWVSSCLGKTSDLAEPYFFLPYLFVLAWLFVLGSHIFEVNKEVLLLVCVVLTVGIFCGLCMGWVWWHSGGEKERQP